MCVCVRLTIFTENICSVVSSEDHLAGGGRLLSVGTKKKKKLIVRRIKFSLDIHNTAAAAAARREEV